MAKPDMGGPGVLNPDMIGGTTEAEDLRPSTAAARVCESRPTSSINELGIPTTEPGAEGGSEA